MDKGWVKADNFCQSPRKGRYIYVLTPSGLEARARLAKRFLQRKLREYDELVAEIERLKQEAGEE
jgi:DNA-binding PadR family transcriptional regulator